MTWEARQAQAQQVTVLATKPDNLSWMPKTNTGSRELIPASCLLTPHRLHGSQALMHPSTQTNI